MSHKIYKVAYEHDFLIRVTFFNGENRIYDTELLIAECPRFGNMQDRLNAYSKLFIDKSKSSICIDNNLSIDAETIWENGIVTESENISDIFVKFANLLINLREIEGLSQRELAAKTGVIQAEISKIERLEGNPSLNTLVRLMDGLGYDISFNVKPKKGEIKIPPIPEYIRNYLDPAKKQGEFTVKDVENLPEGIMVELINGVIYPYNC